MAILKIRPGDILMGSRRVNGINSRIKYFTLLICCLFLTGCYTDFTPDIDTKPVLCVNSLITAGEPIDVEVSHTWVYTDMSGEENNKVEDAVVSVYVGGKLVGEDYIPREGDEIRIHVVSPVYGEAEATVVVPEAPVLKNVEYAPTFREGNIYETEGNYQTSITFDFEIHLTIADSPSATDYYHYSLDNYPKNKVDDDSIIIDEDNLSGSPAENESRGSGCQIAKGSLQYELEPIFSEHVSEVDDIMGAGVDGFTFFTDRQFSGSDYRMNLQYKNSGAMVYSRKDDVKEACDAGFIVMVSSVSESYYKWSYFCWQMYFGSVGEFSDIGFSDAIKGYSNVSTGAGVVTARSIAKVRLPLDDFLIKYVEKGIAGPD